MTIVRRGANRLVAAFTIRGRINRTKFNCFLLLFAVIIAIAEFRMHSDLHVLTGLLLFWPAILITGRRLHDIDMSAWWMLVGGIPYVGFLFTLYLMVKKGDDGPNFYGEPPEIHSRANSPAYQTSS